MAANVYTTLKHTERISQLWDALLADPVPPDPASMRQQQMRPRFEKNDAVQVATWTESLASVAAIHPQPARRSWKVDLAKLFHSLLELEGAAVSPRSDAFLDVAVNTGEVASAAVAAPFRWQPKPAWIDASAGSSSPLLNPADPRRFVAMPKIPRRPLHKQPFYLRFLFCLRRWLSRKPKTA